MRVLEICVVPESHRIKLMVQMPDPDRFLTSQVPHLPKMLFRMFPRMAMHKCENGLGLSFRQECRKTEIPHLFEHLIIELQSQAQPSEVLRGETVWNWTVDPRGHFHVSVDYENELLAVGAIRLAEKIMTALDRREIDLLDIDSEMARLRDLARLGRELIGQTAESHWSEDSVTAPAGSGGASAPAPRRAWSTVPLAGGPLPA